MLKQTIQQIKKQFIKQILKQIIKQVIIQQAKWADMFVKFTSEKKQTKSMPTNEKQVFASILLRLLVHPHTYLFSPATASYNF